MRTIYINGEFVPENKAHVSVFDRGLLFADGIYEVVAVMNGKLLDFDGHAERLKKSATAIDLHLPTTKDELLTIFRQLVQKNNLENGLVYLQLTRGNAGNRDFLFPDEKTPPTLFLFTQEKDLLAGYKPLKVMSIPDLRWARRDIKTTQLLYPSMAKTMAKQNGFDDAWLVENGVVNEGTSNNAHIICGQKIITRNLGHHILPGITRATLLEKSGFDFEERPFTLEEAKNADEAFITAASIFVMPVVGIDDRVIGDGKPGPMTQKLRESYIQNVLKTS